MDTHGVLPSNIFYYNCMMTMIPFFNCASSKESDEKSIHEEHEKHEEKLKKGLFKITSFQNIFPLHSTTGQYFSRWP
jgi:hypothetical protein